MLLELILTHSLQGHLLLHHRNLRLLRVHELLLLLCLALASVVDPFQLHSALGFVGSLQNSLVDDSTLSQMTDPILSSIKLIPFERRRYVERLDQSIFWLDQAELCNSRRVGVNETLAISFG